MGSFLRGYFKDPANNYLKKGDFIKLRVGTDKNNVAAFMPVFLNDDLLVPGKRSVRIFRLAWGATQRELHAGEEWVVKVVAYKIKKNELTKDGREKLLIFVDSLRRIEYEEKELVDDTTGMVKLYSGEYLIRTNVVDLSLKREEYWDAKDKVLIIVICFYTQDNRLFKRLFYRQTIKSLSERLREAGIDVQGYIKNTPVLPESLEEELLKR